MTDRQPPHHNTLTCYANYGCRLPECVERKNAWARTRDRALRNGTWQPRIDATPAREHLAQLIEAGITQQAIAKTLGVPHQSISDFTHHRGSRRGLRHTTDPQFAARILALTPETINAGRGDATGTHRRIRALVAAGWPLLHIGAQFGMNQQRPEQILRSRRVYAATRTQVADGYEKLRHLKPECHGVPKDKARHARDRAATNRWPDPKYWADRMDVIDDPDFEPLYGVTRRELIAQDAHELIRYAGLDRAAAAERLGVSKSYVEHALAAHPQNTLEVAA
ncbi:hypothetical protein [Streptomyces sp. NPDC057052]|uniref:hypothetical protein n=1 Tax=Streptomyces sp. NPDC057052 TaxID=3346010 RepID=UPI00363D351D